MSIIIASLMQRRTGNRQNRHQAPGFPRDANLTYPKLLQTLNNNVKKRRMKDRKNKKHGTEL
uniref:Uncharacterized protein n=1 Tax=Arundo donax TaxID=35708 RepID=A0A0A8ZP27_ARUDO